jgi:hypothetical protein
VRISVSVCSRFGGGNANSRDQPDPANHLEQLLNSLGVPALRGEPQISLQFLARLPGRVIRYYTIAPVGSNQREERQGILIMRIRVVRICLRASLEDRTASDARPEFTRTVPKL